LKYNIIAAKPFYSILLLSGCLLLAADMARRAATMLTTGKLFKEDVPLGRGVK